MNAISLYVSTSQLLFQNDCDNKNLSDLYRLLPYLRQSLSCKTCGKLLIEPYSPSSAKCQHHICKLCLDDKKNSKTSCAWCCDKQNFIENRQLRILLQCYKSLCEHIKLTPLYQEIHNNTVLAHNLNGEQQTNSSSSSSTASILDLIEEGAKFHDDYQPTGNLLYSYLNDILKKPVFYVSGGLSKSAISLLPSLYSTPNSLTTTSTPIIANNTKFISPVMNVTPVSAVTIPITVAGATNTTTISTPGLSIIKKEPDLVPFPIQPKQEPQENRQIVQGIHQAFSKNQITQYQHINSQNIPTSSSVYSVLYAGNGNKITIKRKIDNIAGVNSNNISSQQQNNIIKSTTILPQINKFKRPVQPTTISPQNNQSTTIYKQQNILPSQSSTVAQLSSSVSTTVSSNSVQLKKKGCRCGNATLTPGKLTCCGQRCPCYVESKSCIDCKCRGCRNPHHPNGFKVRHHIPQVHHLTQVKQSTTTTNTVTLPPLTQTTSTINLNQSHLNTTTINQPIQHQLLKTHTTQVQTQQLPQQQQQQPPHTPQKVTNSTLTLTASPTIYINEYNQFNLASDSTINSTGTIQLQQFLNSALPVTSTQQTAIANAAFSNTSNFNQFLNNTIIFNPADIPTIIDGGNIQTAEISIDL